MSVISILLVLGGVLLTLTSCTAPIGRTLVVGVLDDVADWSVYSAESDVYFGIEIDLARKLAERMEYSGVRFVPVESSARLDVLQSGEADCVQALLSVTDERSKLVDFSAPCYTSPTVVYCESSTLFDSLAKPERRYRGRYKKQPCNREAASGSYERSH